MKRTAKNERKNKQKVLGKPQVITKEAYDGAEINSKVELIADTSSAKRLSLVGHPFENHQLLGRSTTWCRSGAVG